MLNAFWEWMPLWLVRRVALRYCERMTVAQSGVIVVVARPDVLINAPVQEQTR